MKRILFCLLVVMGLLSGYASISFGQVYPERPVTLVVPMAPGDATDIAGRAIAEELGKVLKTSIVPLNKPGAATAAGNDFVVKSKKDGYTILFATAALISSRVLQPETVPYDLFKDLTPLGLVTQNPFPLVVRNDAPYKNFKEMVEYSKKNPGKIRCATMGVGSIGHFAVEIVNMAGGTTIEMVPFKGASPAITALLGGHVEAVAVAIGSLISHLRSGALKAMVSSVKIAEFPDVPTLRNLGYAQDLLGVWFALYAPTGIPSGVRTSLVSSIERAARDPSFSARIASLGMVQDYETPEKLVERMKTEYQVIEQIAKKAGMVK